MLCTDCFASVYLPPPQAHGREVFPPPQLMSHAVCVAVVAIVIRSLPPRSSSPPLASKPSMMMHLLFPAIYAEGREHAMAVGITKMSTADMKEINKVGSARHQSLAGRSIHAACPVKKENGLMRSGHQAIPVLGSRMAVCLVLEFLLSALSTGHWRRQHPLPQRRLVEVPHARLRPSALSS